MPFGLGPKLECRDCGHKGRPSISDGMGYLSDSNYHVKCPKCGNNMWADDPTGAWKKRAEEERAKRGLEDAAAKAPTPAPAPAPAPEPAPAPAPEAEPGTGRVGFGAAAPAVGPAPIAMPLGSV